MSDGPPRRTTSSMQLSANMRRLEEFRDAFRAWVDGEIASGQVDIAPVKRDELVRAALRCASDMNTACFRDGIAVGEARERLKHVSDDAEE